MINWLSEEILLKFIKYGVVGFIGMGFDFGTTWLCKEKLKIEKYIANGIGFMVAATVNYFLNRLWTFHSYDPQIGAEYFRFIVVSAIGLGVNTLILWLLVKKFKMNFYLAKLFAIGITTLWNFVANVLYTFTLTA